MYDESELRDLYLDEEAYLDLGEDILAALYDRSLQ